MVSHIIHCTKIFFSSSPISCFFCFVVYKSTFFFLFWNTSYKGLILRRCTFVTWWLLLVWLVMSRFDPAHAVLMRDHPEFSRNRSLEIIRRQSWMTQSAPSWLGGRQPEELDVAKTRRDPAFGSALHYKSWETNTSSASPPSFVLFFVFLSQQTLEIVQTLTVTRDLCRQTIQHCGRRVTSAPRSHKRAALQHKLGYKVERAMCWQAFKTGPLSRKTTQSEAAAAAWPRTPATVYKLMWERRKNKRGRKQVVGQPTKQTKKKHCEL